MLMLMLLLMLMLMLCCMLSCLSVVTCVHTDGEAAIAIGMTAEADYPETKSLPGWRQHSWGWHSDDGMGETWTWACALHVHVDAIDAHASIHVSSWCVTGMTHTNGTSTAYSEPWGHEGDVVGCGVTHAGDIFFTRNSVMRGMAYTRIYPRRAMTPIVGMDHPGSVTHVWCDDIVYKYDAHHVCCHVSRTCHLSRISINFGRSPFRMPLSSLLPILETPTHRPMSMLAAMPVGVDARYTSLLQIWTRHMT